MVTVVDNRDNSIQQLGQSVAQTILASKNLSLQEQKQQEQSRQFDQSLQLERTKSDNSFNLGMAELEEMKALRASREKIAMYGTKVQKEIADDKNKIERGVLKLNQTTAMFNRANDQSLLKLKQKEFQLRNQLARTNDGREQERLAADLRRIDQDIAESRARELRFNADTDKLIGDNEQQRQNIKIMRMGQLLDIAKGVKTDPTLVQPTLAMLKDNPEFGSYFEDLTPDDLLDLTSEQVLDKITSKALQSNKNLGTGLAMASISSKLVGSLEALGNASLTGSDDGVKSVLSDMKNILNDTSNSIKATIKNTRVKVKQDSDNKVRTKFGNNDILDFNTDNISKAGSLDQIIEMRVRFTDVVNNNPKLTESQKQTFNRVIDGIIQGNMTAANGSALMNDAFDKDLANYLMRAIGDIDARGRDIVYRRKSINTNDRPVFNESTNPNDPGFRLNTIRSMFE